MLEMSEDLTSEIIKFAATRSDSAVFSPTEGYYSFDTVAEAFEQGVEHAEANMMEKIRSNYFDNATRVAEAIKRLIESLKEIQVFPNDVFINLGVRKSKALIRFSDNDYISENLMNKGYQFISDIQSEYFDKGTNITIGYIGENVDEDQLKNDGFDINIDLQK